MPAHGGERMAKCFLLAPLVNGDRAANPLKTLTLCENPRAQGAEHAVRMADGASCQPAVAQRRMPCLDVEAAFTFCHAGRATPLRSSLLEQFNPLTCSRISRLFHVRPARSIFSNALNFCRSAIAALVRSP
jgi:hypothetical protein